MSEHDEQKTFFDWVRLNRQYAKNELLRKAMKLCYAVPNGSKFEKVRNKKGQLWSPTGKKMKEEGLEKGMPDINLDWATPLNLNKLSKGWWPSLRIEMKFGKNKLTKEQREKKDLLEQAGFRVVVAYSAKEAIKAVVDYLPFKESEYQGLEEFLR